MKFQIGTNPVQHDEFVKKSSYCDLLQSSKWAQVKDNWGSEIISVLSDTNEILASALVLIKSLPVGFSMLYMPRGPIMDYSDHKVLVFFFAELRKFAKTKKALFVKFDPMIVYETSKFNEQALKSEQGGDYLETIKSIGAQHFGFNLIMGKTIQPRIQANERLQANIESIYPKHTRRLMKDAINRGVKVVRVGEEGLEDFARVVNLTENRKGVALRNFDYFKKLMDLYGKDAYLHLATVNIADKKAELNENLKQLEKDIAETPEEQKKRFTRLNDQKKSTEKTLKELEEFGDTEGDKVIAGILSVKFGDTTEMLYAGMDDTFKKFYPQYVLYTLTFNEAYADGSVWANMGGVQGSLDDGLSKFKSNFNPDVQRLLGEFTLRTSPLAGLGLWAYNKRKSSNLE
ncbi:peptidoglycan bridge formation glycyltransferase FemA/FemB family protein [Lactovum miscens]|uniref:Serine/alanine adding enzyme n=1 Tax=Lactovum miscens TaxID=190387 RepID=A0A841CAK1_9LACT|nr:peptidoglycan bridge formation glycyltransferase FemA/FemB family protein [Lactovum miscens]MBB5888592.1 serine/alanine adding enzyme [Lactovum miscens]